MTLNEALAEGLKVTGIGLLIVFSVLAVLMFTLVLMEKIFYKKEFNVQAEQKVSEEIKQEPVKREDNTELIAVLTAAVAASLNTSTYNLKIKSFRRIGNSAPAWNRAGMNEVINTRF